MARVVRPCQPLRNAGVDRSVPTPPSERRPPRPLTARAYAFSSPFASGRGYSFCHVIEALFVGNPQRDRLREEYLERRVLEIDGYYLIERCIVLGW